MKQKTIYIIALTSLILLSGCNDSSPLDVGDEENNFMSGMKPFKEVYYNCSSFWTNRFEKVKPIIENATHVDEIGLRDIVHYIDKELLIKLSKQRDEVIVCGKHDIKHYEPYRRRYWEGHISEGTTSGCSIGNIEYEDSQSVERNCYNIICCIDGGYCYKHIFNVYEYEDEDGITIKDIDYSFCNYHKLGCWVKNLRCGDESIE